MASKLEKLPQSRMRLTVTVGADILARHYETALKKVAEHIEIKGFRKGHAPKNLVIERAGNGTILNEMLDLVLPDTYYEAVKEHEDLIPVEQPKVDVKEFKGLDDDNLIPSEMIYTAEFDVMPNVDPGDYKKIRVKPKTFDGKVEDKEIDGTIEELKKIYADDYLKLGNFKDEKEMREAVAENIKQQKVVQAESETYDMILEALLKKTKVEVPEAFIHNEIHRMEHQIEMQAKAYGMTLDDWLKQEKKTHEDIHKDWRPQAEKAAKVGLLLGRIAELEGIDPTQNDSSRLVMEKLHAYATGEEKK